MALVVVKCGGAASELRPEETILPLHAGGDRVCVVHGAGPQISEEMKQRGLPVRFVGGRRYTSAQALEVVRDSLEAVNARLISTLGPNAVGLMGDDAGLKATRIDELGHVGEPACSAPTVITNALDAGRIPVVAPLAEGPLNVNADDAAAALAIGLDADRLLFLTDVPGVYVGGAVAEKLDANAVRSALAVEAFEGGIVPKLRAAARAAEHGIQAEIGHTRVVAEAIVEEAHDDA